MNEKTIKERTEFNFSTKYNGYYLVHYADGGRYIDSNKKHFFTIKEYKTIMRQYKI